jgi:hypothetical protein
MTVNLHSVPISNWDAFTLHYLAWDPKLEGDPVEQGIFRGEATVDYEGGRVQTLEVHFPVPFSGGSVASPSHAHAQALVHARTHRHTVPHALTHPLSPSHALAPEVAEYLKHAV